MSPLRGAQVVLVSVDHTVKVILVQKTDSSHENTGMFPLGGGMEVSECSTVVLHTDIDIRHPNSSIGGLLTLMKSQHDLPHRMLRPDGMDLSNALFFYHRLKVVTPQSIAKPHCPLPGSITNAPMIGSYAVACNPM